VKGLNQMRAIGLRKYGSLSGLGLIDLPLPEPGRGEVRVRVHASAINPADYKVALGLVKFLHARSFPMVLGYDFSGVIEAVGENSEWKIGDAVFGFLPYGPFNKRGAFAETVIAKSDEIALKPAGVSHIQAAAAATPALTAIQAIRDVGKLPKTGGRVLVTGISGGVGSMAVGIITRLGAVPTAAGSGRGIELAKKSGAGEVIDRKQQNVFDSSHGRFDVIFDAAAAYRWSLWKGSLKSGGQFVTTLPSLALFSDKLKSLIAPTGAGFVNVKCRPSDLRLLGDWLDSGLSVAIDSTVPVRDVATGIEKLHRGEVLGRIAVDVINGF
jgi:NADPH:quinone reductase-like Zn-dependent oxidoreductase